MNVRYILDPALVYYTRHLFIIHPDFPSFLLVAAASQPDACVSPALKAAPACLMHSSPAGLRFDGVKTALLFNTWRPPPGHAGVVPAELARHFHAVVESCEEGAAKPDPTLFRSAVRRRCALRRTIESRAGAARGGRRS